MFTHRFDFRKTSAALLRWIAAFAMGFSSALDAESYWQISMDFSKTGELRLLSADPIPPSNKTVRSPNAEGGFFKIPVDVQWLDADGMVLTSVRTTIPLGTRTPASEKNVEAGMLLGNEVFVLRVPGPEKMIAGRSLRVRRVEENAARSQGILPQDSSPRLKDDFTFPLGGAAPKTFAPPPPDGPVSSVKIKDTGPDANRLVMVFVGDGYIQADLDNGAYAADVARTLAAFGNDRPWDEMLKVTNVYRINVLSNERGADYENAAPGSGGILKDTYFQNRFYADNVTQRLLAPSATGTSRAIAAANSYVGVGNWDQIVMVVNSQVYGGSGGSIAVNSANVFGPAISVHEVGHSFAGLADEYDFPGTTYTGARPPEPNVDTVATAPKWSIWIDPLTPMPTPDLSQYSDKVGVFLGAKYNQFGIYRPWRSCTMRDLNAGFCPVCREQHLKKLFSLVTFTDSVSPLASTTVPVAGSRTFSVNSLPIGEISYEWFLNGQRISGATSASLPLSTAQLPSPSQSLAATARYTSAMMRSGAPSASFSWTVQNTGVTPVGTPHWWLASMQLGVAPGDDLADPDGDGQSSASEYIASTDPRDRASMLRFSTENIAPSGGSLAFQTKPGRRYALETSFLLSGWQAVSGYTNIDGSQGSVQYTLPASSETKRFYRIRVWIP